MPKTHLLPIGECKCPDCETSSSLLRDPLDVKMAMDGFALGGPDLHICLKGDKCMVTHSNSMPHTGTLGPTPQLQHAYGYSARSVLGADLQDSKQKNSPPTGSGEVNPRATLVPVGSPHHCNAIGLCNAKWNYKLAAGPHSKQGPSEEIHTAKAESRLSGEEQAADLVQLLELVQHNHRGAGVIPDQSPEIHQCAGEGQLGDDQPVLLAVCLQNRAVGRRKW